VGDNTVKILLIGKTGQLGSALIKDAIASGHDVFAPAKHELDVTNKLNFLTAMKHFSPDIVINTAAYHNVPLCEENPMKAFQVNCTAVKEMAEISTDFNAWFVSFSTDYVFDGTKGEPYIESDTPNPLQKYGWSKLAGEYAALLYPKSIIIRTCGLYGLQGATSKGGNFVDNRIKDSGINTRLEVSNDQTVNPTYTGDLSKAVLQLITHTLKESGIYHLVNQGSCTWYEFTKEIFTVLNINTELVPVSRKGITNNLRRPLFSALKNEKAAKIGVDLPDWKTGLTTYLDIKYLNKIQGE
jgi:dTDP-4-dehydrorhamnose reductase